MNFRTLLFWAHLSAGCLVGTVILTMSVTGLLLAFRPQIIGWADRDIHSTGNRPPDIEKILASSAGASTITLRANRSAPAEVAIGRDHVLLRDMYSGKLLGESYAQAFLMNVEVWHRWLGVHDDGHRVIAHAIKSACNLAFLFMIVSGLYLWMPRKWTRRHIRAVALFRSGVRGRARDFNWHNVLGLWCAVPLLVISLTGVVMSYPWANDLLFKATGTPPPVRNAERPRRKEQAEPDWTGLNSAWLVAEQQSSAWGSISLRLPRSGREPLVFTIDTGDGGRPDQRSQVTINRRTSNVVRVERFSDYNAGRRLRTWVRFTHTGEAGGIAGRTVAALAACGAVMLVWTGFWLTGRRYAKWRSRAAHESVTALTNNFTAHK